MVFSTRCFKSRRHDALGWLLVLALLCWPMAHAWAVSDEAAASAQTSEPQLKLERADNALWLSAQFGFALPPVVEDALLKGIPIYFAARAEVVRQRWYWFNRTVASAQRRARLAYHPLTQRWRLSTGTPQADEVAPGLSLSQNFDSLPEAMAAVRRISHWKVADVAALEAGGQYRLQFSFELDTTELPRPLQIGTLGQSDWVLSVSASQSLAQELIR